MIVNINYVNVWTVDSGADNTMELIQGCPKKKQLDRDAEVKVANEHRGQIHDKVIPIQVPEGN